MVNEEIWPAVFHSFSYLFHPIRPDEDRPELKRNVARPFFIKGDLCKFRESAFTPTV